MYFISNGNTYYIDFSNCVYEVNFITDKGELTRITILKHNEELLSLDIKRNALVTIIETLKYFAIKVKKSSGIAPELVEALLGKDDQQQ